MSKRYGVQLCMDSLLLLKDFILPYLDQNGFWICISLKGHLKQNQNADLTVHLQIESLPYKGDATWGPSIVYHLQNLLYWSTPPMLGQPNDAKDTWSPQKFLTIWEEEQESHEIFKNNMMIVNQ